MSNVPAGSRGVPTATLVVVILLILFCGVMGYVFYTEADGLEAKLLKEEENYRTARVGLEKARQTLNDLKGAIGYSTKDQIEMAFKSSTIQVDPKILERLIETKFDRRAIQIKKEIGVDPKDVDESGQSKFLEKTITEARRNAVVPDNLKGTKVGDLIDRLIRRDKAVGERKQVVTDGEAAVTAADQKIDARKTEIERRFTEMDAKARQARQERIIEQDKLRFEPLKWAKEEKVLDEKLTLEQAINRKLERKLKAQEDTVSPVDGKIVAYDWRTGRGAVNLGARDKVKNGYEFDVYSTRPGPEGPDKRLYRGRIQLLDVYPDSSIFTGIASQWDSDDRPIMAGNYVVSQLYDATTRKTFVLKGWFPKGGDYSKEALAGKIVRDGGIVKDELLLDTDYLVVGIIDGKELTNPSVEARQAIAEGAQAYKNARHWYVPVLTVEKFFRYMDRTGTQAAP